VGSTAASPGLTLETISSGTAFARLDRDWDHLVRAMPRPSPVLLHGWLSEWWRHFGDGATLAVQVAYREGRLVAALPLCVRRRRGLRVLTFLGEQHSALADALVAPGEEAATEALARRASEEGRHDFADLFGMPSRSRLVDALGDSSLRLVERAEAPVVELDSDWETLYRAKMSSKARAQHRRRRRNLEELGRLEVVVSRTADELVAALEDAFVLHALRWDGRPDGSGFLTPTGMRFHRAAIRALADVGAARIVTLKLDGRAIAFHYFFLLEERMYVHRIGFDPSLGRHSPGVLNTFDAIEAAALEGATRVEFLGGAERYKLDLADRFEPLYQGLGLARTPWGAAVAATRLRRILVRKQLKRSHALRHFYFESLAPARRLLARIS